MRYLPTSKLTPGMALGQDIYDGAGRLLLAKHLLLSEEYISNLEFLDHGDINGMVINVIIIILDI